MIHAYIYIYTLRLGNFDTTRETDTNTTRIYRVWVYVITRLWPVNPFMTRLWPVNDTFMTHKPVYDTFMTRLWHIDPFITHLWRDNYIFFTKLTKWVDMLTRWFDTPSKWVYTTTRIAKPIHTLLWCNFIIKSNSHSLLTIKRME
jgi:hypothetical protein